MGEVHPYERGSQRGQIQRVVDIEAARRLFTYSGSIVQVLSGLAEFVGLSRDRKLGVPVQSSRPVGEDLACGGERSTRRQQQVEIFIAVELK